jgi:amino acid adenylation domain-containing protein
MNKRIIHSVFENAVVRYPERSAVVEEHQSITYAQLNNRANKLAHLLRHLGVVPDQIVAVALPSGISLIASMIATFKAGGIYLPVNRDISEARMKQMFQQCAPSVLITDISGMPQLDGLLRTLEALKHCVVWNGMEYKVYNGTAGNYQELVVEQQANHNPDLVNNPKDSNYIFYTSGSTGEAKAILGCHDSLSHFIHWEQKEFGIDHTCIVSQLTQISFDASLRDIWLPLCNGGAVCIPSEATRSDVQQLISWIEKFKITVIHCVPSLLRILNKAIQTDPEKRGNYFSNLHFVLLAGEMLYMKDVLAWQQGVGKHVQLVNLYGPTETTMIKTFHRINEGSANPSESVSVGKPISNTSILILDGERLCSIGEIGCVYIKTPFATKGYYNNQAQTDKVFIQNPLVKDTVDCIYNTGDVGRLLADGTIEILGREDRQLKVNGVRVEPGEIEKAVLLIEEVQEVFVGSHVTENNEVELICYYTGVKMDPAILRTRLAFQLNKEIIPSFFMHLAQMPLNINGKIDKNALPKPETILISESDYEPAETPTEVELEKIWAKILNINRIGHKASFFTIGGNSLKAIQMISHIYKTFNVLILVRDVFSAATINQLGAIIDKAQRRKSFEEIRPIPIQTHYSLSHGQKRLWVLSRFENAHSAYNIHGSFVFQGDLQWHHFESIFPALIQRYEILRTSFVTLNALPWQQVLEELNFNVEFFDLRKEEEKELRLKSVLKTNAQRPFNLEQPPLFRALLIQLEDATYIFQFVIHHIISDVWSLELLVNEVMARYAAAVNQQPFAIPPLRINYKDFAAWQNAQLEDEVIKEHRAFWHEQLNGNLPVLDLPTDFSRPPLRSFRGDAVSMSLSMESTKQLVDFTQQEGVTLFMMLTALVNTLLYRYTHQTDIIIGAPVAGRDHIDLDRQIGFFVNNLLIRTRLDGNESFNTFLQKIKQKTLAAFQHQVYPFDQLVEELNVPRDPSRSPLFDVAIVLPDAHIEDKEVDEMGGLKIATFDEGVRQSTVDIRMIFVQARGGLSITFEYNTDIFSKASMQRMLAHFETLLGSALKDASVALHCLEYITVREKEELLIKFNDTKYSYDATQCIHQVVEQVAATYPDALAIISEERKLTYRELNERSNALALYLRITHGILPDERVALMVTPSAGMLISLLGILKAGGAYVPILPDIPANRKKYILEDSSAKLIITETAFIESVPEYFSGATFAIDAELDGLKEVPENPPVVITPDNLAYIIYTSGSTGLPKGVMVSHRGNVNMSLDQVRRFSVGEKDRVLQFASISFDAAIYEICMAWFSGAALVIPERKSLREANAFIECLTKDNVTVVTLPPSFLSALPLAKLNVLRIIITAGEAANANDLVTCSEFADCYNAYGPTECSVCVSVYKVSQVDRGRSVIPIGKPLSNIRIYILDERCNLVAMGIEGEIMVSGAGLARGYLNQNELSSKCFIQSPTLPGEILYRTGDIGKWLPDGTIEYVSRKDSQVKIRGYRIELGEVEHAIASFPSVKDVVVTVRGSGSDKGLVAYYACSEANIEADLMAHIKSFLPSYMLPSAWVVLPHIPLTSHGKIDYAKLPEPAHTEKQANDFVVPENDVQKKILTIWEQVLNKTAIGIHDNFFSLGGHSLNAIQVLARVQEEFSVCLDIGAFFETATVASLATAIVKTTENDLKALAPIEPQPYYQVSSAQNRMWVLNQFDQGKDAYILHSVFAISGDINYTSLELSLRHLISRHEILRTQFVIVEEELKQRVVPVEESDFPLRFLDVTLTDNPEETALAQLEEAKSEPFQLDSGPLFWLILIKIKEKQHKLFFAIHHIIADEWSMGLFVRELLTLYETNNKQEHVALSPLQIQYKDFAAWQNGQFPEERFVKHREYWKEVFNSDIPEIEIPSPYVRPEVKTFRGDAVNFRFSKAVHEQLIACSRQVEGSLFMSLYTSLFALLYRYTGQTDIIVGTPVALRNHPALQNQIGLYLNTIALRMQFQESDSFTSLLKKVRERIIEAFNHQEYPFDQLVNELNLSRDVSRTPLFDVMLVLHGSEDEERSLPAIDGIKIEPEYKKLTNTKFDLTFNFRTGASRLDLNIEYNVDVYDRAWVERMAQHFNTLLENVLHSPENPIAHAEYMTPQEKHHVLYAYNSTLKKYPSEQTIVSFFESQAEQTPNAPAFYFEDTRLSYSELNSLSNKLANYLHAKFSLQPNDCIAILMDRSERMMIALLGILKASAAYVPIDPNYPQERIAYILKDANVICLLADDLFTSNHAMAVPVVTSKDWATINQYPDTNLSLLATSSNLAYVLYTSGSTGDPKGVLVNHQGLVNRLHWQWNEYGFTIHDIIFQKTPYVFDVSAWELFMPLCFGASLVMCRADAIYDPVALADHIHRYNITTVHFVPGMLQVFLQTLSDAEQIKLHSLKRIITSGEVLLPKTVNLHYEKMGIPLYNLYGPTEASIDVSHYTTKPGDNVVPIGSPIQNTRLYVLDSRQQPVAVGLWGEIAIAGIGLAQGYLNKEELTRQKFVTKTFQADFTERIYLTGDIGRWLPEGTIEFKGRKDNQIKLRGQRIELSEIENTLLKHEQVKASAVAIRYDTHKEACIVAFVVPITDALSAQSVRSFVAQRLPAYMVPAFVVFLPLLPVTINGKLNYKALPELEAITELSGPYEAPASELENQIATIWQEVLGRTNISVEQNFFDVGGTSLRLILVYQKLLVLFPQIKMTDLFKYSTVRSLSVFLGVDEEVSKVQGIEV